MKKLTMLFLLGLLSCPAFLLGQQLPGPTSSQVLTKGGTITFNNPYPNASQMQVEFLWLVGTGGSAVHISVSECVNTQCDSLANISSTGAVDNVYSLTTTIPKTFQVSGTWTGGNASITVKMAAQNGGSPSGRIPFGQITYPSVLNISAWPASEAVWWKSSDGFTSFLMETASTPSYNGLAVDLSANDSNFTHGAALQLYTTSQNCNGSAFSLGSAILTDAGGDNILCAGMIGSTPTVAVPDQTVSTSGKVMVPNLATDGQGYFIGPGILSPGNVANSGTSGFVLNNCTLSANSVAAIQFSLPIKMTVSHISVAIATAAASSHMSFGIYDAAKNKLIDSGQFDGSITTGQTKAITAVALPPGAYWLAWSADNTTTLAYSNIPNAGVQTGPFWTITFNNHATHYGCAANSLSAGALPSTLGAITAGNGGAVPLVLFEP